MGRRKARQPVIWALARSVAVVVLRTRSKCFTVLPVTVATEAPSMAPTPNETASSDMCVKLLEVSFWCGFFGAPAAILGSWLPLGVSAACFCAAFWIAGRDESRAQRKLNEKYAELEAKRHPLSRIVAAEREVLARQGTAS